MFFATIVVCAGLAIADKCDMDHATKAVYVPNSFPTQQVCFISAAQFAAASDEVPQGPFLMFCGNSYVQLKNIPA
jgi:hypothetical protein